MKKYWSYYKIKVDKKYFWSTLSVTSPGQTCDPLNFLYPVIPSYFFVLFSFFLWLLCGVCLRLCLFFRVRKSCVIYLIGRREKCHNRVEIGLWWDWPLGLDETLCHKGNRKLMKSHHMERWCLSQYRTWQRCSLPRTALEEIQYKISRKENQPHVQMYTTDKLWRPVITFNENWADWHTPPLTS